VELGGRGAAAAAAVAGLRAKGVTGGVWAGNWELGTESEGEELGGLGARNGTRRSGLVDRRASKQPRGSWLLDLLTQQRQAFESKPPGLGAFVVSTSPPPHATTRHHHHTPHAVTTATTTTTRHTPHAIHNVF
jgi:hypothetical protein